MKLYTFKCLRLGWEEECVRYILGWGIPRCVSEHWLFYAYLTQNTIESPSRLLWIGSHSGELLFLDKIIGILNSLRQCYWSSVKTFYLWMCLTLNLTGVSYLIAAIYVNYVFEKLSLFLHKADILPFNLLKKVWKNWSWDRANKLGEDTLILSKQTILNHHMKAF